MIERHPFPHPAQEPVVAVEVRVDEPGHHEPSAGVNHPVEGTIALVQPATDADGALVLNQHVLAEEDPVRVVEGQHGSAAQQGLHGTSLGDVRTPV